MRILILGGYGVFGGRLAELLLHREGLDVLIAGRSETKAQAFCRRHSGAANLRPALVDRATIEDSLVEYRPDLLVDASGPFQEYGKDRYAVVEACLRRGVNYLDFADGSDFVFGIDRFDDDARTSGLFVLSGVSSFPVLTAAVIREFSDRFEVRSVTGGIAPSPYAGVGANVMRAVLGYAGGDVNLVRGGAEPVAGGLCETRRYTVSPPGRLPLHSTLYSLVDVPDLRVIPRTTRSITDIWMGAGPVPEFLHLGLIALARLRRVLRLPSLTPMAGFCHWVINHLRYGEHRGGMFIDVVGASEGRTVRQSWHLLAEGDDGPYIPSMAIAILIERLLGGQAPAAGARPATGELTLEDYEATFANRRIQTGIRREPGADDSLFRVTLGDSFDELPEPVRKLHSPVGTTVWEGRAEVRAGTNPLARAIARVFGFPTRDQETGVRVTVTQSGNGEDWLREFGDLTFRSKLRRGRGRDAYLVCETFGLITVSLALVWDGERLWFVPRRWRLGLLPLPGFLLPRGRSHESLESGRFAFNVTLEAPVIGLLAAYKGTLSRADIPADGP